MPGRETRMSAGRRRVTTRGDVIVRLVRRPPVAAARDQRANHYAAVARARQCHRQRTARAGRLRRESAARAYRRTLCTRLRATDVGRRLFSAPRTTALGTSYETRNVTRSVEPHADLPAPGNGTKTVDAKTSYDKKSWIITPGSYLIR